METSGLLNGRTALVTGAAGGIGGSIATAFAQQGARLALTDMDSVRLDRVVDALPAETRVSSHIADLVHEDEVERMVGEVFDEHGAIDVLVNSAGMVSESRLTEMDTRTWDEMLAVDLRSVFLCCRRVVPHMVRQRWGRVITISSQLGLLGAKELSHYSAAKAGLFGLTKALAREVAGDNVLVNTIAPGPIETPMIESLDPEYKRRKREDLPLGRFGVPVEVAPTAVLLASDPGGNLYVGQTLGPNSGDVMP